MSPTDFQSAQGIVGKFDCLQAVVGFFQQVGDLRLYANFLFPFVNSGSST